MLFREDFDGLEVLSSLPEASRPWSHDSYRLIYSPQGTSYADPAQPIGLTVAGLSHVEGAERHALEIVKAVGYVADQEALTMPNPYAVVNTNVDLLMILEREVTYPHPTAPGFPSASGCSTGRWSATVR